ATLLRRGTVAVHTRVSKPRTALRSGPTIPTAHRRARSHCSSHGARIDRSHDNPPLPPVVAQAVVRRTTVSPMDAVVVAAVQATPVFCDRDATIEKVAELTKEAADHGARLVAFSEGFVPTYPDWVWRTTPWGDRDWYARWFDQTVDIPGPACDALGAIAREHRCYLAIPVNERDGGTVYNTLCYFGPDGDLLAKHRKLVATGGERLVWGSGDGSTLAVIETPFGCVVGLICRENYMPLARAAMYEQGIDVLVAPTWDNSKVWPLS